jgi:hypothetical protein
MLGQQFGIEAVIHLWGRPSPGGDNCKHGRQNEKDYKNTHHI